MKKMLAVALAALASAACSDEPTGAASAGTSAPAATAPSSSVEGVLQAYAEALRNTDAVAATALYEDDGVFLPAEAPTAVGRAQIKAAYEAIFRALKIDLAFTVHQVVEQGDYAVVRTTSAGSVVFVGAGTTGPEAARELFVLHRRQGAWKIAQYMFNTAAPPAAE